jgi:XisI protein
MSHELAHYRQIIRDVLKRYSEITDVNVPMRNRVVFNDEHGQYFIMSEGWDENRHLHGCVIHLEIVKGKIWGRSRAKRASAADRDFPCAGGARQIPQTVLRSNALESLARV